MQRNRQQLNRLKFPQRRWRTTKPKWLRGRHLGRVGDRKPIEAQDLYSGYIVVWKISKGFRDQIMLSLLRHIMKHLQSQRNDPQHLRIHRLFFMAIFAVTSQLHYSISYCYYIPYSLNRVWNECYVTVFDVRTNEPDLLSLVNSYKCLITLTLKIKQLWNIIKLRIQYSLPTT